MTTTFTILGEKCIRISLPWIKLSFLSPKKKAKRRPDCCTDSTKNRLTRGQPEHHVVNIKIYIWNTIVSYCWAAGILISDICKRLFLRNQIKCPSPFFFILNLEISQCADDGVCRTINAYDLAALLASGAGRLSAVFKFLFGEQSLLLFSLSSELSIILTFLNRQTISS